MELPFPIRPSTDAVRELTENRRILDAAGITRREIRRRASLSQVACAACAGVSPPTIRLYEADSASVTEPSRSKCDELYARILDGLNGVER